MWAKEGGKALAKKIQEYGRALQPAVLNSLPRLSDNVVESLPQVSQVLRGRRDVNSVGSNE